MVDELGYLPIDQKGADLLFRVISQRYEHGSIILTTNKLYKKWATIFNNDTTITSAVLDRLLHHAETVIIEGKSYGAPDRNKKLICRYARERLCQGFSAIRLVNSVQ